MLSTLIIGLREGLEAALIVGMILASLHRTGRLELRSRIWLGVGLAVVLSVAFGVVLSLGMTGLDHSAQELVSGILSLIAVGLITWMILWMAGAAATLRRRIDADVANAVIGSGRTLVAIAFLAVAREGTETALFLWAAGRSDDSPTASVIGAVLGLSLAVALGWLLYRPLVRIDLRRFFAWTGGMLVLIAAGVLSHGIHGLQETGLLPGPDLAVPAGVPAVLGWLWGVAVETGSVVPPHSLGSALLSSTLGITPTMTWLQTIAWLGYLAVVMTLFVRTVRGRRPSA